MFRPGLPPNSYLQSNKRGGRMEKKMIRIQISNERYLALRPGLLADYQKYGRIRTINELCRVVGSVTAAEVSLATHRLSREGLLCPPKSGSGTREKVM